MLSDKQIANLYTARIEHANVTDFDYFPQITAEKSRRLPPILI
jgi:hypothetical protein